MVSWKGIVGRTLLYTARKQRITIAMAAKDSSTVNLLDVELFLLEEWFIVVDGNLLQSKVLSGETKGREDVGSSISCTEEDETEIAD